MVQCPRTCILSDNHSPACIAGEWLSETTHKKGERKKQALKKGSLVLSFRAQSGDPYLVEFPFHLFIHGNLQNSAVSTLFPKPCRLTGWAAFFHASFLDGKTLLQEHARGDGF
jgi:hypothetical protein